MHIQHSSTFENLIPVPYTSDDCNSEFYHCFAFLYHIYIHKQFVGFPVFELNGNILQAVFSDLLYVQYYIESVHSCIVFHYWNLPQYQ